MRAFLLVALCCLMPMSSAFAQQSEDASTLPKVELPPELERVLRDYERAWENRDAAALAALFTEDGFVLRPEHSPVRGRDAIETAYQNAGGPLHLHAFAFERADSIAYIVGGYTSTPKWPDAGKFILTLRRTQNGRWLIAADMDNSNR